MSSRIPYGTYIRLQRGEVPVAYTVIETLMGKRVYAKKALTCAISGAIEQPLARVVSFGRFERTVVPYRNDVLTAYAGKQLQHFAVKLDNHDGYFSRIMASEPFIGMPIQVLVGFEAEPVTDHRAIVSGTIVEVSGVRVITVEADER